jgi:hypothetical protein
MTLGQWYDRNPYANMEHHLCKVADGNPVLTMLDNRIRLIAKHEHRGREGSLYRRKLWDRQFDRFVSNNRSVKVFPWW